MKDKEDTLIEIFCDAYDFWNEFAPMWHAALLESTQNQLCKKRKRLGLLCPSGAITKSCVLEK